MPNFNLNLYLLETVGYKRCLTKLIKLHHGSQTQMKGYFFYLPDQFSWILLCNNNSGNDLGAKEPCSKNGKGNILSKQTQGSFGEMPVLRWKVPTFFWISLHLQPLLSSYPLAQQTTFFPVLPPQHCLCQHNFRAFWGRVLAVLSEAWCWAMEKAAQERLWGVTALLKALWALYWRGKLSSGWEQQRVGTLLLSLKLCDGIPDGPDSKGPMQVFSFTIKKSLYKSMWLFALSILLCALLNTAEDTAGLDPKTVNAIYDLAEEVVSVLHVLLALAWI